MSESKKRKLERLAALGDLEAKRKLNRLMDRTMDGVFSHLIGNWAVFVDDYSHYRGKVIRQFNLDGDIVFHVKPAFQCGKFYRDNESAPPQSNYQIDSGDNPAVIRSSRFKCIIIQPNDWPQ